MHLIAPLASGVVGAENGTALIRRRGSSASPTCYSDFEGTIVAQPATGFTLDANGRYIVYVNELVDVDVADSGGTSVTAFTAGDAAPNVEVRSLAFTGTDYDSGVAATGSPTTVQAVLDGWLTSAGKQDFNVLFNGASSTLQNALGSIAGIFINVKSPAYGATGDGAADDTTPIQNALTAATTPHSIVFFPYGTYRITAKLTVPVGVSLWGVGAEGSKIAMDHATADTLEYGAGTSTTSQEIRGMGIGASQANSGKPISLTSAGARKLLFVNSVVNAALNYTGDVVTLAGDNNSFIADTASIYVNGTASYAVTAQNLSSVYLRATSVNSAINLYTGALVYASTLTISDSSFVSTGTSAGAGTSYCVRAYSASNQAWVRVSNSFFKTATNGPIALSANNSNLAGFLFNESNNVFSGFTSAYAGLNAASNSPSIRLGSRDALLYAVSSNVDTDVKADQYGITVLTRTTNTAHVLSSTVGASGSLWTLVVYNNSGGNFTSGNLTFGTGFVTGTSPVPSGGDLTNGKIAVYQFRAMVFAGGGAWVPVAAPINNLG